MLIFSSSNFCSRKWAIASNISIKVSYLMPDHIIKDPKYWISTASKKSKFSSVHPAQGISAIQSGSENSEDFYSVYEAQSVLVSQWRSEKIQRFPSVYLAQDILVKFWSSVKPLWERDRSFLSIAKFKTSR